MSLDVCPPLPSPIGGEGQGGHNPAQHWRDRARCAGFTDWTEWPRSEQLADCYSCPVRKHCLAFANQLEAGLPIDIRRHMPVYGGLTGLERHHRAAR